MFNDIVKELITFSFGSIAIFLQIAEEWKVSGSASGEEDR